MRLIKGIYKFFDKKIILPITRFFVNLGNKLKKLYRPFESFANTKSSIIILSLLLSLVIFYIVDEKSTTLLETNAKVLYNQPVTAVYNDEEYVVEGLPKTVDITMIGTKANLYLAKQLPSQAVTIDLNDLGVGVHQVNLKYKQAISSVEYKLDPSTVTVVVSPKQSLTKDVSAEIVNLDKLDSKLSVESVKLSKDSVIVKGTEEKIKQVATVKALVNINDLTDPKVGENKIKDVKVRAYDKDGKILNVEIVPNKINATVNIESPNKEVPLEIVPKGIENIIFGKSIESIESSINKVTIYGTNEALDKINSIKVDIDVSDLKGDKTYTKTIKKPNGVREISNKTVNIKVKLGDEATTEISGVKLSYSNLNENYIVQVTKDSTTEIPVILKGARSSISKITPADITANIDLKDLEPGEHEVKIDVTGIDNKIIYSPKVTDIKVIIIKK